MAHRTRIVLFSAALMGALASFAGSASAATVTHDVPQTAAQIEDYWTPQRMESAQSLDLPAGENDAKGKQAVTSSEPPDQEIPAQLDTTYPYRIHGRLFLRFGSINASCSATVVTAASRDLIMTAGHCVFDAEGNGQGVWASTLLFVPGYRNGVAPFGAYAATRSGVPPRWVSEQDFSVDLGALNLAPGPGGLIQDQLGSRGISFNRTPTSFRGQTLGLFGYPAEPEAFYDGQRSIFCNSGFRGFEQFTFAIVASPCHMQQGASGGGWVLNGTTLVSVTSHSFCVVAIGCDAISGTYLGNSAFGLWKASGGGITRGQLKKIKRCKRFRSGKKSRCIMRAETFPPIIR